MLKIVEFIKGHENWKELLSKEPYNLKISEDDGYVLFKYDQISSDFNEKICREARGLILDSTDDFKVVRFAFEKFFNLGECYAAHIDWDTAVSNEKIDGSLMSVWYARDKWHLSTNGVIDAFKAEISGVSPYKTFGDLFESVLPLSTFAEKHYENMCFTFELVSPFNTIVINYPKTKVYLLSVRFMNSLEELDYDRLNVYSTSLGVKLPQFYYMNDEKGFRKVVENMDESHEGIVVRDKNNNRVKIKTPLYFKLHKMAHNGNMTLEYLVSIVRANEQEEFLSYFPQYTNEVLQLKEKHDKVFFALCEIKENVKRWLARVNGVVDRQVRKDFSEWVKKQPYPFFLYFNELDNKNNLEILKTFSDEKYCSLLMKISGG